MQLLLDLLTHLLLASVPLVAATLRRRRALTRRLLERRVRNPRVGRRGCGARVVAHAREPAGGFRGLGFRGRVIDVGGCGGGGGGARGGVVVAAVGGGFVAVATCAGGCCRCVVVDAPTCGVGRAVVAVPTAAAGSCCGRGAAVVVRAGLRSWLAVECCARGGAAEDFGRLGVGFGVDGLVVLVGSGGTDVVMAGASCGAGSGLGRKGCGGLAARFVGSIAGWCTAGGGGERVFVGNLAGYFGRIGRLVLGHASVGEEGILGISVVVAEGTGLLFESPLLVHKQRNI